MQKDLLRKYITNFLNNLENEPGKLKTDQAEREERINYYQYWTKEKIRKHSSEVPGLDNIKFWDYEEVLAVNENLEFVNTSINKLNLIP